MRDLLPVTVCLRLPNPLNDRIPILSPVDFESRLGQFELIIFPPLTPVLHPTLLFVSEFIGLGLEIRATFIPFIVPKQQDGSWVWGSRDFERVLRRVVDQDLRVDLFANLGKILLESEITDSPWVRTSALFNLVISSCPCAIEVS